MRRAHSGLSSAFRLAALTLTVLGLLLITGLNGPPALSGAAIESPPPPVIAYGAGAPAAPTVSSTTTSPDVQLPPPTEKQITANSGGTIATPDGRLTIDFPPAALPRDARVTIQPLGAAVPDFGNAIVLQAFRINLKGLVDEADIHDLNGEVTITIKHTPAELSSVITKTLRLIAHDRTTGAVTRLPSQFDKATMTLTAETTHFSDIYEQGDPAVAGPARVMYFENDLYSGAATTTIPIEVPAGAGSFGPRLSLNYSSGGMDNKPQQGSWVGMGWSLELGSISYAPAEMHLFGAGGYTYPETWFLNVGGVSDELVKENATTFHTKHQGFYKISKDVSQGGSTIPWVVTDKSGTVYEFNKKLTYAGEGQIVPARWYLTRVYDRHSNEMTISYRDEWWPIPGNLDCSTQAVYPTQVVYNGGQMKVEFVLDNPTPNQAPRGDHPPGSDYCTMPKVSDTRYLTSIKVKVQDSLVSEYRLSYTLSSQILSNDDSVKFGTIKLDSLQTVGANGSSVLSTMNFTYTNQTIHGPEVGYPLVTLYRTLPYLTLATNGFGGTTTYTYEEKYPTSGSGGDSGWMWSRYAVTQVSHNPGVGPVQTRTFAYTDGPKYHKWQIWVPSDPFPGGYWLNVYARSPYRGWGQVTVTNPDNTQEVHYFHTIVDTYSQDDEYRTGRPNDIQYKDAFGAVVRRIQSTWTADATSVPKVKFVHLDQTSDGLGSSYNTTTYSYDAYGNVSQKLEYGDQANWYRRTDTTYAYNTTDNIVDKPSTVTVYANPASPTVVALSRYVYDNNLSYLDPPSKGDLTKVERQKDTVPTFITWRTLTYDSYGNPTSDKDANNNGITAVYDATLHIYPTSITNALNQTTSYTWDTVLGRKLTKTDTNNVVTNYTYDVFGRLDKVWDSLDTQTYPTMNINYTWDGTAPNKTEIRRRTTSGTADIVWTVTWYDGFGRPVQTRNEWDAAGKAQVVDTAFDSRGNKSSVSLPYITNTFFPEEYTNPNPTVPKISYTYDVLGRATQVTNPDNTTRSLTYTNRTTRLVDEKSHCTDTITDALDRKIEVKEFTGTSPSCTQYATTTFGYDVMDRQTAITDNLSNTRSFSYNTLGFLTALTDPDRGNWSYAYDDAGRLLTQVDARNIATTFTYDALNRVTQKNYSNNDPTASFFYDSDYLGEGGNNPVGRLTKMADGSGMTLYKYDLRGRKTKERRTIDAVNYDVSWTYNAMGNVLDLTYPDGEVVRHAYETSGLLSSLKQPWVSTYISSVAYAAHGLPSTVALGNGRTTTYTYRTDNLRLQSIVTGGSLQNLTYTYDNAGNVTQIADSIAGETTTFGYDDRDRLTSASGPYTASYSYDSVGRMTAKTEGPTVYTDMLYSGPKPHALMEVKNGATSLATFGYDANGNMSTKTEGSTTTTYTYDAENRMTSRDDGPGTVTYVYDGQGNLVKKTTGGQTTVYIGGVPDSQFPEVAIGTIYEKNLSSGEITKYYWAFGKRIAMRKGSTLSYLLGDKLGSTSVIANSSGAETGRTKYYPYGTVRSQTGTMPTDKKFTGGQEEGSLLKLGRRYYAPSLGQFIQPDPLNDTFFSDSNPYLYVHNNPLTLTDPSGQCPWCVVAAAMAAAVCNAVSACSEFMSDTLSPQQVVGHLVQATSSGDSTVVQGNVTVVENCQGTCQLLFNAAEMFGVSAIAITVGDYIFARGPLEPPQLRHELTHVQQEDEHGFTWFLNYFGETLRRLPECGFDLSCAYEHNQFEVEANQAAQSQEDKQNEEPEEPDQPLEPWSPLV